MQTLAKINEFEKYNINVRFVPPMSDILTGRTKYDEKIISFDELLGREPIPPRQDLLKRNINKKVVMVSGAGGSIGSELCTF